MKRSILFLIILMLPAAFCGSCPYCHGGPVKYYNIDIYPETRIFGEEITINATIAYMKEYTPVERTDVTITYYNSDRELTTVELETGTDGTVDFMPKIVGYHLIKTCGKSMLIYVNTTCGDGICGGIEGRGECPEDCGSCGDGICDTNEDISCYDCSVCGDGICSLGETRSNCLWDCVLCGDGICDYLENRSSCAEDCPSGAADGCCDAEEDGKCDPDCYEDEDPDCRQIVEQNSSVDSAYLTNVGSKDKPGSGEDAIVLLVVVSAILLAAISISAIRKIGRRKEGRYQSKNAEASKKTQKEAKGEPAENNAHGTKGKAGKKAEKNKK